jgi:rhodanese-related sulfurtransferase
MRILPFVLALLLLTMNVSLADSYNFISAEQMKTKITTGNDVIVVDIQEENDFNKHHLPGSIATYAYPVKTDSERATIDKAIAKYNETGQQVVIVCPRGEGGAKRCYDYMKSKNVPEEKLTILEKGMAGWPYTEMLEKQ